MLAGIEFKSQVGSFGNNYNNRTEEAIGSATDIWAAYLFRQMEVSYRATSIAVLGVLASMILTPESLLMRPPLPAAASAGEVSFDVCAMWEQIGSLYRLSSMVWVTTFIILMVQGLRNRILPRFIVVLSLAAFAMVLHHEFWRATHCYSNVGMASFVLWALAVCLMCFHHVIQRPAILR